jgi:hypothetical protein
VKTTGPNGALLHVALVQNKKDPFASRVFTERQRSMAGLVR